MELNRLVTDYPLPKAKPTPTPSTVDLDEPSATLGIREAARRSLAQLREHADGEQLDVRLGRGRPTLPLPFQAPAQRQQCQATWRV